MDRASGGHPGPDSPSQSSGSAWQGLHVSRFPGRAALGREFMFGIRDIKDDAPRFAGDVYQIKLFGALSS
jgi:hypothetical protein